MFDERYARQVMLPEIGEEGQHRLASASVLLVGLGGLGSTVAPSLAGAGVGRLGLCDPDVVSWSNLPRQTLYTEEEVGRPKCEMARRRLAALSSATRFDCIAEGLTPENAERLVASYDLVVDCCDNFATRYLIDDACAAAGRPWVSSQARAMRSIRSMVRMWSRFSIPMGLRVSSRVTGTPWWAKAS